MVCFIGINHFRQTVQGLWTKYHVYLRCSLADLIAFLTGDTATNTNNQIWFLFFELSPTTQLMKELFLGLFPNRTGIHQKDISLFRVVRQFQSMSLAEQISHTGGIVLVHLTTVSLDIQFFAHFTLYWTDLCLKGPEPAARPSLLFVSRAL